MASVLIINTSLPEMRNEQNAGNILFYQTNSTHVVKFIVGDDKVILDDNIIFFNIIWKSVLCFSFDRNKYGTAKKR